MKLQRRTLGRWGLAACASPLSWPLPPGALAAPAAWPDRPLRLLVVYPPGGVSDGMARVLAEPLSQALGVPVLVEHRAGAGGAVGMGVLARAAPDGRTLAFSAISPLTLQPLLTRVRYDPLRAFVPVVSVMRTPVLVVGTPAFAGRGFDALVALARAQPGAVRWASSGMATVGHMVLVQVRAQSGAAITHIPYQGGGPQLKDALAGQFEVLSTNVAAQQLQYIESGRLQPLAVGAPARLDVLPDVPTLAELGFPQANLVSLFGLFAPARTPAAVVQRLHAEINRMLETEPLRLWLREAHNLPAGGSMESFAREIALDRQRNRALVAGHAALFD
ncbi:tripartite tricarboxylate transporter substrate binding protein [Variovorax sp. JS1663]|uniref:tripartite tricarboxylate transporter substrate binding protein n=1 Tax=Variovorax sp. JS1663 TaxID=1851577 RepID=UPI000B344FDE|nr:tripartite tricarboxylate transporter substrate binding protein [Variovorax sp. JS1663]OUM01408.1 ABC transporter substrate-binding protein [Variovorax sp. JS1663]